MARVGAGLLVSLVVGAPSTGAAAPVEGTSAARPPNVLLIAIDDLNDWVGALGGHPQTRTPNIDRLSERGTLFTRAYAPAPACNPSRTAMLTGRRPSTSGVYYNWEPFRTAMPDVVTLPQHFRRNGYRVEARGKIFHLSIPDPASWDDESPGFEDPVPSKRPANGIKRMPMFDWGPVDAPEEAMGDRRIADRAAEFLSREQAAPFFLAVGLDRTHLPWYLPADWLERFPPESTILPEVKPGDLDDVPEAGRAFSKRRFHQAILRTNSWSKAVAAYLASVSFVDAMVGRVLDALDAGPSAGNTIVVLVSDHGYHLGQKEHWRKFALWEEATRIPLVIATPDGMSAPGRSGRTVSLLDIYPTLVELAGLPPQPDLEGRSLAPLLADPEADWDRPVLSTYGPGNHAVRSERWRYIRYADGSEELYDHDADPHEWTNLAGDPAHAAVKRRLAARIPEHEAEPSLRPIRKPAAPGSGP